MNYEIECPITGRVRRHATRAQATETALQWNRSHSDHPAVKLYHWRGQYRRLVGELHREFGKDFAADPWEAPR